MNNDLAGKAIRGELGWENTSLFNPDHINAQLYYTALVRSSRQRCSRPFDNLEDVLCE